MTHDEVLSLFETWRSHVDCEPFAHEDAWTQVTIDEDSGLPVVTPRVVGGVL